MNTDVILKLSYAVLYLLCLIGQHYGLLPAGSELIAVGIFTGEGVATAIANAKAASSTPAPQVSAPAPAPLSIPDQQG